MLKKQKIVYKETVELDGGIPPAVIEIARAGQQHPSIGDKVRVVSTIYLPTNSRRELHDIIQYDNRVKIGDQPLSSLWGYPCCLNKRRYRCWWEVWAADTWEEAERIALEWARKAIQPLLNAQAKRRAALERAG